MPVGSLAGGRRPALIDRRGVDWWVSARWGQLSTTGGCSGLPLHTATASWEGQALWSSANPVVPN